MRLVWVLAMSASLALAQSQPKERPEPHQQKKEKSRSGHKEGIEVHGHWVLEIRNPDGTVASRREFENSLAPGGFATLGGTGGGSGLLVGLLTGYIVAGGSSTPVNGATNGHGPVWSIYLNYSSFGSLSNCSGGQAPCYELILNQPPTVQNCLPGAGQTACNSSNLIVQPAGGNTQMVFQGASAPSPENGVLNQVQTVANTCVPGVAACTNSSYNNELPVWIFTSANINLPIQAGQTVNVNVIISFM